MHCRDLFIFLNPALAGTDLFDRGEIMTVQYTGAQGTMTKHPDGTVAAWQVKPLDHSGTQGAGAQTQFPSKRHLTRAALEFLTANRGEFKLDRPLAELKVRSVETDQLGLSHIRFDQEYHGIPVKDADLIVHLDPRGEVYRVNGRYIPTPSRIDIRPSLPLAQAFSVVARDLGRDDCPNCKGKLIIFQAPSQSAALAWQVKTSNGFKQAYTVVVDAVRGHILQKTSAVRTN